MARRCGAPHAVHRIGTERQNRARVDEPALDVLKPDGVAVALRVVGLHAGVLHQELPLVEVHCACCGVHGKPCDAERVWGRF